jgi:membrane-associated phospholipid phosphatase
MGERKSTRPAIHLNRGSLIGLAINFAVVIFFAWLAGEMLEGDTLRFDDTLRESINQLAASGLTALMQAITFAGSGFFLLLVGALISIAFLAAKWWRALLFFFVTMGGATLLNIVLKTSFGRTRPSAFFGTPLPTSFSFPSGHALLSLCFYCAIAYLIASRLKTAVARFIAWLTAILLISAIGFSRIYLGVHYPSDVIAGYTVGIFWFLSVILLDRSVLYEGAER